ncbi:MAG: sigma-70 family RNA polymerase sigma factor [Verrucomicrobia bacterium]|nr:sigma-70 family RNA polymerase sigma factor [Verrucomicrobiota bacterium]
MNSPLPTAPRSLMNRACFSRLIDEHHRPLLAYARVLTTGNPQQAKEIVQDAFIAAWQAIGRFDVSRDFGAWLRGIVRNKWREQARRHSREVSLDEAELESLESSIRNWCGEEGQSVLLEKLADCRGKLPEALASTVDAYYGSDDAGHHAADALGIAAATLRKRLERARSALRDCLEQTPEPLAQ